MKKIFALALVLVLALASFAMADAQMTVIAPHGCEIAVGQVETEEDSWIAESIEHINEIIESNHAPITYYDDETVEELLEYFQCDPAAIVVDNMSPMAVELNGEDPHEILVRHYFETKFGVGQKVALNVEAMNDDGTTTVYAMPAVEVKPDGSVICLYPAEAVEALANGACSAVVMCMAGSGMSEETNVVVPSVGIESLYGSVTLEPHLVIEMVTAPVAEAAADEDMSYAQAMVAAMAAAIANGESCTSIFDEAVAAEIAEKLETEDVQAIECAEAYVRLNGNAPCDIVVRHTFPTVFAEGQKAVCVAGANGNMSVYEAEADQTGNLVVTYDRALVDMLSKDNGVIFVITPAEA